MVTWVPAYAGMTGYILGSCVPFAIMRIAESQHPNAKRWLQLNHTMDTPEMFEIKWALTSIRGNISTNRRLTGRIPRCVCCLLTRLGPVERPHRQRSLP